MALPGLIVHFPLRTEPIRSTSVDLREGTNLVITAAYERFSAALAAARKDRRRGRPAELSRADG